MWAYDAVQHTKDIFVELVTWNGQEASSNQCKWNVIDSLDPTNTFYIDPLYLEAQNDGPKLNPRESHIGDIVVIEANEQQFTSGSFISMAFTGIHRANGVHYLDNNGTSKIFTDLPDWGHSIFNSYLVKDVYEQDYTGVYTGPKGTSIFKDNGTSSCQYSIQSQHSYGSSYVEIVGITADCKYHIQHTQAYNNYGNYFELFVLESQIGMNAGGGGGGSSDGGGSDGGGAGGGSCMWDPYGTWPTTYTDPNDGSMYGLDGTSFDFYDQSMCSYTFTYYDDNGYTQYAYDVNEYDLS